MAHDTFISYSREDTKWVEEELLPGLEMAGLAPFLDSGQFRSKGLLAGILPGQNLKKAIKGAIQESRVMVMVLTSSYYASRWCNWEMSEGEKYHKSHADRFQILRLRLGEVDATEQGEAYLYVDLSDVRQRYWNLGVALRSISKNSSAVFDIKLGSYSCRQLRIAPQVKALFDNLQAGHRHFVETIARMQALKAIHDCFQRAQDAWEPFSDFPLQGAVAVDQVTDLKEKARELKDHCDRILKATEDPMIGSMDLSWKNSLVRAVEALALLLAAQAEGQDGDQARALELYNSARERTKSCLMESMISVELSTEILAVSKTIPKDHLGAALDPLRRLVGLPWNEEIQKDFDELTHAFDAIESLLKYIRKLIEVHDNLQYIEKLSTRARSSGASELSMRDQWGDIELRYRCLVVFAQLIPWLEGLDEAVASVGAYFKKVAAAEVAFQREKCMSEFGKFRRRLNQGFHQTDTDILNRTNDLGKTNTDIESLLKKMAEIA